MLFEHGSEFENTQHEPFIICMMLYTVSVADQTDHSADVFVHEKVAYGYDVVITLRRSKVHRRRHFL